MSYSLHNELSHIKDNLKKRKLIKEKITSINRRRDLQEKRKLILVKTIKVQNFTSLFYKLPKVDNLNNYNTIHSTPCKKQKLSLANTSLKYKYPSLQNVDYNFSENVTINNSLNFLTIDESNDSQLNKSKFTVKSLKLDKNKINMPKYNRKYPSFKLNDYLNSRNNRKNKLKLYTNFTYNNHLSNNIEDTSCTKFFKDLNDEVDLNNMKNKFRIKTVFDQQKLIEEKKNELNTTSIGKKNIYANNFITGIRKDNFNDSYFNIDDNSTKNKQIYISCSVSQKIQGLMKKNYKYDLPKLQFNPITSHSLVSNLKN